MLMHTVLSDLSTAVQTAASAPEAGESYSINISDEAAPLAMPEVIEDENVPQAFEEGFWALINLLSALGTCLIALGMIVTFLRNRKEEEEGSEESESKRRKIKFFGLVPAAAAVIAFLLTEDMSLTMQMTDRWTILMVVILIAGMAAAFLTRNRKNNEEDEAAAEA